MGWCDLMCVECFMAVVLMPQYGKTFMVSMGLGQLGVDLILENGHIGFKDKIVLHSLKEVKCHQGYTSDFCYLLFNLLGLPIQGRIQSFFRDTVI